MRDDHLDRYHQAQKPKPDVAPIHADPDEVESLLADLIQADNVDAMKALSPSFLELPFETQRELQMLAVTHGSPSLLELILVKGVSSQGPLANFKALANAAIESHNSKALGFVLYNFCLDKAIWMKTFEEILKSVCHSDLTDVHSVWEKYATDVRLKFKDTAGPDQSLNFSRIYTSRDVLSAVVGAPYKEQTVLRQWKQRNIAKTLRQKPEYLGNTLINVAKFCCSIPLARYLIEAGARVDYRKNERQLTALHQAARNSSVEAAELTRFLLQCGADPDGFTTRGINSRDTRRQYIRDEKGAKELSKWLGVSWDELVAQIKQERQEQSRNDDEQHLKNFDELFK